MPGTSALVVGTGAVRLDLQVSLEASELDQGTLSFHFLKTGNLLAGPL